MEENFSTGREWVGGGSGSNVSDGEWQMNLHSLANGSSSVVQPSFKQPMDQYCSAAQ